MILESIFMWVGGITLIGLLLWWALKIWDRIISTYAREVDVFYRVFYVSLFVKNPTRWLNQLIKEKSGKKYKIIEVSGESEGKR